MNESGAFVEILDLGPDTIEVTYYVVWMLRASVTMKTLLVALTMRDSS